MIDLSLNADQRAIVDGVVSLLAREYPVARLHQQGGETDLHSSLAQWGWFGLGLPEAEGGLGLGIEEEVLLFLEAGRFLLPPGVLATTLAAGVAEGESRKALIEGHQRAAVVLSTGEGGAYCFDRRPAQGQAQLLVRLGVDELSLYPMDAFMGDVANGIDETVQVERGTLAIDAPLKTAQSHRGPLLVAAMLAGIAKTCSELAVEYARTREQFGQAIGAFQAVKHRCADMAVSAYAAEAQVLMAATSTRHKLKNGAFQVAAAARTAMGAARSNGTGAVQVHGGMGFTAECDVHLYLKRAHLLISLIGGLQSQNRWLLANSTTLTPDCLDADDADLRHLENQNDR